MSEKETSEKETSEKETSEKETSEKETSGMNGMNGNKSGSVPVTTGEIPEARLGEHIGEQVYCVEVAHGLDVFDTWFADLASATAFAKHETEASVRCFRDHVAPARVLDKVRARRDGSEWSVDAFVCRVVSDGSEERGWRIDGPEDWNGYIWSIDEEDWLTARVANEEAEEEEDESVRFHIPSRKLACDGAECIVNELDAEHNLHERHILRRWAETRDGEVTDFETDALFEMELGPEGSDPWAPTAADLYRLIDWNRAPFRAWREDWLDRLAADLDAQVAAMRVGERRMLVSEGVELVEVVRLPARERDDPEDPETPGEWCE